VAQQPEALKPMSEDETRGTKLTPNAVEPGTFGEHLRGLNRGVSPRGAATQPASPDPTRSFPSTPPSTQGS
jgi:hypothetical protein